MAKWTVGGVFIEGLSNRNFDQLARSLAPHVRLRALLPPGPLECEGADAVAATFRSWFGDAEGFDLLDAAVGAIGDRLHLSWRARVCPPPFGIGEGWYVIEQHAFADATDGIDGLDLLCSGFHCASEAEG